MALLLSAVQLSTPTPASAGNFSGATGTVANCGAMNPGGLNATDPNPFTFFHSALEPATYSAVEWARVNRYDPTSINTSRLSSVDSLTDVVSYDQDYTTYCGIPWHHPATGGVGGSTICVSLASGGACEKHEIRYDLSFMNVRDQNGKNTIACHEIGHAVGLAHRDAEQGCMRSEPPFPGELTYHDVEHINGAPWIIGGESYLYANQAMRSWDGRYTAIMQGDGNFVVYGPASTGCPNGVCWASATNGPNRYVRFQGDGNFVIYVSSAYGPSAVCQSGTYMYPGSTLEMQNDSNLVIYSHPGHIARRASEAGGLCV